MHINVKLNSDESMSPSKARMQHLLQGNESKALHMGAWGRLKDWFQYDAGPLRSRRQPLLHSYARAQSR